MSIHSWRFIRQFGVGGTGFAGLIRVATVLLAVAVVLALLPAPAGAQSSAEVAAPAPGLYVTDGNASPGSVYSLAANGSLVPYYTRRSGALAHFAFSLLGDLFFTTGDDFAIYMVTPGGEQTYFTARTFVKDLAFGPDGLLYFSLATGGGGDGAIWRLTPDVEAELVYNIPLSAVDGFWAGDFAFGSDGAVYLSSGNTAQASIYRLDPADPSTIVRLYRQPDGKDIDGLISDASGAFYFTDQSTGLYRLNLPAQRTVIWSSTGRAVWDVNLVGDSGPVGPALYVSPRTAAPGAGLRLSGNGFAAYAMMQIALMPSNRGGSAIVLANVVCDDYGAFRTTAALPLSVAPGLYTVAAVEEVGTLADTPLTIGPALTLQVDPAAGPPGTSVAFTVANLVTGTLRLDYAGLAVMGPIPVGAGSFSGSFVVPGDRPAPLGSSTVVTATNLVHGATLGTAGAGFTSQVGPPPPVYRVANLQAPTTGVPLGGLFTITGQISPPPMGPLPQFKVLAVWKTAAGQLFPISAGDALIQPGGDFQVLAKMPSLLAGDPFTAKSGDQVGVALFPPGSAPTASMAPGANPWPYADLQVKVVKAENPAQVIQGAKVTLTALPDTYTVGGGALTGMANEAWTGSDNQASGSNDPSGGLTDEEKQQIELAKALCPPETKPANPFDQFPTVVNPSLDDILASPSYVAETLQGTIVKPAVPLAGPSQLATDRLPALAAPSGPGKARLQDPVGLEASAGPSQFATDGQGSAPAPAGVLHYLVTVDALAQGYGELDGNGFPRTTSFKVDFYASDGRYHDLNGALLVNPVVVTLPLLPGSLSALGPIGVQVKGLLPDTDSQNSARPIFSRYYSLVGLPSGTSLPASTSTEVRVVLTPAQNAMLATSGGLKLYLDGVYQGAFGIQFQTGVTCKPLEGAQYNSGPYFLGKFTLANPHLLAPAIHDLRIDATLQADPSHPIPYDYGLRVEALPAKWFAVPAQGARTVSWSPSGVTLSFHWLDGTNSMQTLSSGTDTKETGPLENATQAFLIYNDSAKASGFAESHLNGNVTGKAINRSGTGMTLSGASAASGSAQASPAGAADMPDLLNQAAPRGSVTPDLPPSPAGAAAGPLAVQGYTHTYGPQTETIVPKVTYDLGQVTVGIPFVAQADAGAESSYAAYITYAGTATVQNDGSTQSTITVTPEAQIGIGVWVDAKLLGGILAKAKTELFTQLGLNMPITYATPSSIDTGSACFKYRSDFTWEVGVGCVPLLGCLYYKTDSENIFNNHTPKNVSTCGNLPPPSGPIQAAPGNTGTGAGQVDAAAPAVSVSPAEIGMAIGGDGLGNTAGIWEAGRNALAASFYDGMVWSAPLNIPTGLISSGPQIAFYAPNRALAVWTEVQTTTLTVQSTITDALKMQHIAYATWDGVSWSAAKSLTQPSLGEGGAALAGCMSTSPACPAGGAVTAVWERNVSADLNARQIRLYYATYHNGAWTAPMPVDPAAGSSTDILPSVAYAAGTPLVAWVRDSDADLTNVASRRVAVRPLNAASTSVPGGLPDAIAEVSLAVGNSGQAVLAFTRAPDATHILDNRRPLWFATLTCAAGSCTASATQQRDPYGRAIYAESPIVTLNSQDTPAITFRGMGFGANAAGQSVYPGDPPGMWYGTGELAQLAPNAATGIAPLSYLTQDGAVNWQPAAWFDPMSGSTLALAVKGVAMAAVQGAAAAASTAALQSFPLPASTAVFGVTPELPDFAVVTVDPSTLYPQAGQAFSATVQVANLGLPWAGDELLALDATWDGDPGLGAPAGHLDLTGFGRSQTTTVTLPLAPPPGTLDVSHMLTVTVNSGLPIAETSAGNNARSITLGGLPAPAGLAASTEIGSPLIFLKWDPPADPRVTGYRIYRSAGMGPLGPVGSSFTAGWVDPAATHDVIYHYAVSAFTDDGIESDLSGFVQASTTDVRPVYLPLLMRGG
jgi:hypothetical protein